MPHHVPRAKGSLKAGKEQTKKFEGKAKEDGEKLGNLLAKEHLEALQATQGNLKHVYQGIDLKDFCSVKSSL